jgi:N-glycosylase/DNA lyase
MKQLLEKIQQVKESKIKDLIDSRIREFEEAGRAKEEKVFSELCFCLMTANFSADKCIKIQKNMGRDFEFLPEEQIAKKLREFGHRFPNTRANYIHEAKACRAKLYSILKPDGKEMRKWLVENVKGLGMKEASHFLRNIGYKDVAIIDFHILDLLEREKIITKPKTLNEKNYLEIEEVLEKIGKNAGLNLAELDLYLWYLETGKVLK